MRTRIVPLIVFSLVAVVALAGTAAAQSEDPNPDAPRWVEAEYAVSLDEELQELTLDGQVAIHKVETSDSRLQRQCGGSTCSADDLREAYRRAGDSGKQRLVDEIESGIEARVQAALEGLAGAEAGATSQATVDETSLAEAPSGSEYQPPIPVDVAGSAALGLLEGTDLTAEQGKALFRMGARVDQPIEQNVQAGTNLTLSLSLASPVALLDAGEGSISADGTQVTWRRNNWRSGQAASIEDTARLGDPDVRVPTEQDAEVAVKLDISDVDVDYTSMFGSDQPAEARVAVSVDGSFAAIQNPRPIDRVELPYLSADAVRIALANDLLDTSRLISLEDRARRQTKATFESMTGEPVAVTGGFPANDLSEDAIGEPAGTGDPIELTMNASARVSFPPADTATQGATGFTVTTIAMGSLNLPQLDTPYDVDTSITLVLPEGLDLTFEEPEGYTVEEHTVDDRKAYTFSPNGNSGDGQQATIQNSEIVVNHPFVWDVFWPLILTLVLLLVVLPAVVIGLTIRRRRKRGPPRAGEPTQPVSGSQATERSQPGEE